MSDDPISQRLGTTVRNKWTLERVLGSGGMAAVYVGIHRIGRRDALKILHPQAAQSKEICERFEREAHVANRFHHPGAVEIRDIDVTEDGAPFLVMELLEGESLSERERRLGAIPIAEVLDFAEQVADTLSAAHAQGIIHRDVKPANLFVIDDRTVKVLDFGLARIRQDSSIQGELTRMGLVLGTTPYMPPEQARGHDIDARADVFALGATMFRLIAGRHVHDAASDFELLMKMAKEPAPPLASVEPSAPPDVCVVVDRALAFDREQRYPDAATMLGDVRALRRRAPPPYATAAAGSIDRGAPTHPTGRAAPAAGSGSISVDFSDAAPRSDSIAVELSSAGDSIAVELSSAGDSIAVDLGDLPAGGDSIVVDWAEEADPRPAPAGTSEQTLASPGAAPRPPRPHRG